MATSIDHRLATFGQLSLGPIAEHELRAMLNAGRRLGSRGTTRVRGDEGVAIAASATAENEIASARAETITRLVNLEAAANNVAAEQTDRTLRSNFRALAVAAGLKYTKIRSIKPANAEGLLNVASDTGALESAVNKLEPACGKYW